MKQISFKTTKQLALNKSKIVQIISTTKNQNINLLLHGIETKSETKNRVVTVASKKTFQEATDGLQLTS